MSDEIVFDVLCTKVLDALRALGLGKFSIRNYYYEGMWPIIKVYRSEGVIFYSAAFTNENGYRDFCFMRLMYDTAARCQELVDAKIHDLSIRKTHATICLTGKGNKLRIVPISPSVVELLKTYLDKAHPTEQRQSDDYLFFTTHHGRKSRMSTDAVNLFMKKYGEMARRACPEVPERVHPHQLRHSRAMHLYRAGMPLVLLSEFLGHADINTTRIYAWADTEMKRQAIQKVSKVTEGDTIEPIWANDEELIKRLYGLA